MFGPNMNEKEAAAYLTYERNSLRSMRCRGTGPAFIKLGRKVVYQRSDLDAFLEDKGVRKIKTRD